jgi:tetratricopeptide (TPR) repeat protein
MDTHQQSEFVRLLQAFQEAQASGDIPAAESLGAQCLAFAAEDAARHPTEALRLMGEADEYESTANWEHAEATRRCVLALAENEGHQAKISKAHGDLGNLFELLGRSDQALREFQAAVAAARKFDLALLLQTALGQLARCYLSRGDAPAAFAAADEAVRIAPAEPECNLSRARALLARTRCLVELGRTPEAQRDLDASWPVLAPLAEAGMLAGVQSSLASWWEISARIKCEANDFAGAAQALGKAVEYRRIVASLPQLAGPYKFHWLTRTLQEYSAALAAAGEAAAAAEAGRESRELRRRIGASEVAPDPS